MRRRLPSWARGDDEGPRLENIDDSLSTQAYLDQQVKSERLNVSREKAARFREQQREIDLDARREAVCLKLEAITRKLEQEENTV